MQTAAEVCNEVLAHAPTSASNQTHNHASTQNEGRQHDTNACLKHANALMHEHTLREKRTRTLVHG